MIIDISHLDGEYEKQWSTMMEHLSSRSKMFATLYIELQKSDKIYTIRSVSEIGNNPNRKATATFDENIGDIKILTESNNMILNINSITEDLFHAYQSETDYMGGLMNKEFEAAIFKMCVNAERTYNMELGDAQINVSEIGPLEPIRNAIDDSIQNTGNPFLILEKYDKQTFISMSSDFIEYCRSKNITNINYYAPTTTLPIAIISLYNKIKW